MGAAVLEGPVDGGPERSAVDVPRGREQRDVGEIFDPRVGALARQGVGVQLLCDVGLQRVDAEAPGLNANEVEEGAALDLFRMAVHWLGEGHIDPEGHAVDLRR